jgi:nucleoside 2-deoxyribosyltransferase
MSIKIYIAAPFVKQHEAREKANELISMGFTVTSRWVDEDVLAAAGANHEYYAQCANIDIEDINAAQYFLLLADHDSRTGGKHFETGYAYATGKKLMIVGRRENVFHYLPQLVFAQTWEEAKSRLGIVAERIKP